MFGDVYSNRGIAGDTAGASPGDSPVVHSPVLTRVLLVADEGGPEDEPSGSNATASARIGVVPVRAGTPVTSNSGTTTETTEERLGIGGGLGEGLGGLGGWGSWFAKAARRGASENDRTGETLFAGGAGAGAGGGAVDGRNDAHRVHDASTSSGVVISTFDATAASDGTTSARETSVGDPPTEPRTGGTVPVAGIDRRIVSGAFREAPLVVSGTASRLARAKFAFDPWTKLPVRVESESGSVADGTLRRRRLRWCWRLDAPSWWVAFLYLLGSSGFAAGGFASCARGIVSSPTLYFHLEVLPYTCGGVAFFLATSLLVYTSWTARYGEPGRADRRKVAEKRAFLGAAAGTAATSSFLGSIFRGNRVYLGSGRSARAVVGAGASRDAPPSHRGDPGVRRRPEGFWHLRAAIGEPGGIGESVAQPLIDSELNAVLAVSDAMEEARRLWLANDSWTRRRRALELVSSGCILFGVLLYKVMVFTMFARCVTSGSGSPRREIAWSPRRELLLYTVPSVLGSVFFCVGSYVLWCAVNRTWSPPFLPRNTPTWIAWLSVLGSVLYLLGSLPPTVPKRFFENAGDSGDWFSERRRPSRLTPEWPFLFVGFFLGSLVFAAQSLLMIHEIAESAD